MDLAASVISTGIVFVYGIWGVGSQEAEGTLTLDTEPSDGDTFTVDGRTYTFQTALTDVNGNIAIGGSLAQAKLNLVAAFDLSGTPGVDFAASMVAHETVDVAAFISDDAIFTAKVGGTIGNSIVTTETFTAGTNVFDAATLGTTTAGADTAVFERGNNFSGDGTAKAPYADPGFAQKKIFRHLFDNEGSVFDKNYVVTVVSKSGENNTYNNDWRMYIQDDLSSPWNDLFNGTANSKLIFQGWNKDDGEKTTVESVSTWTNPYDLERPILKANVNPVGYIQITNSSQGGYAASVMQWKDLIFDMPGNADGSLIFNSVSNLVAHSVSTPWQFFGCIFRGGHKSLGVWNTNAEQFGACVACIWENTVVERLTGVTFNTETLYQNVVFTNLVSGIQTISFDLIAWCVSCVGIANSGKVYETLNSLGTLNGEFCAFKRNSSLWAIHSTGVHVSLKEMIDAQSEAGDGGYNHRAFDIDPLFEDESANDYRLKAGSIAESSGGLLPGKEQGLMHVDVDSKAWHKFDFLNNIWVDTTAEVFNLFGTIPAIRTRRSMGAFQTLVGGSPQNPVVHFPTSSTEGSPQHIVIKANASPQGGTIQCQIIAANDADLTDITSIKDSVPINITTSNNKLNFKEDAGGELTATLTVGVYSTDDLLVEIKTQLESAGAGTYAVTYDGLSGTNTQKFTIAVSGGATTVQFLFHSGTDLANSSRGILGFGQFDTLDVASHESNFEVRENHYDATVEFKYDDGDYDGVSNPALQGTWTNDLGTGDPSGSGTPGVDGAEGDGTRFIRTNMPALFGLDAKYIGGSLYSGGKVGVL